MTLENLLQIHRSRWLTTTFLCVGAQIIKNRFRPFQGNGSMNGAAVGPISFFSANNKSDETTNRL